MVGETVSRGDTVLCEQIRVVDRSRIVRSLGHLDNFYMQQIAQALSAVLGLFPE